MSEGTVASRWNLDAIEDAHRRWKKDPSSVDASWRYFFEGFELGAVRPSGAGVDASRLQTGVIRLIYAYRDLGHFLAHLDPLNDPRPSYPLLELTGFGLSEDDMDRVFDTSPFIGLPRATLRDLLAALKETYCRTIGVEYMHIQDTRIRRWLQERMEPRRNRPSFDHAQKLRILRSLHYAELFERFLQTRYTGQKRFSLEGAETLIPMLEAIVEKAPDYLIREIILGMSHRGRLNVLANTLRKPYEEIFAQFEENYLPESVDGDGDVKYHLGFSSDRVNSRGLQVHLSLAPNPSHLEAVNPVVEGRTRAKQTAFHDLERKKGVPVLIHGDAAFAGQGLVAETLNLSQLEGYTTGGTIHIIVNNQIGFTTSPTDARSTTYCTDVGKMIQAPVFHVNGEDAEASVYVAELALEFRQTFGCDIIIDMYCYRRMGHNEGDDPSYTQPVMYEKIKKQPKLTSVYQDRLIITGDLTADEAEAIDRKFEDKLDESLHEVKQGPHEYAIMHGFDGRWQGLTPEYSHAPVETGVAEETLRFISEGLVRVPDDFSLHPKLAHQLKARHQDLLDRKPVDWAFAELLAFGSLLLEETPVRLSGQDSRRGTFSQRHAVYFDYEYGYPYVALNHLRPEQAQLQIYDSLLSEAAVLGFEFGYALDAPDTLVMWEAQFGDFSNGAQVIIDQFVASSESKWQRDSGVVMLLPHGYEGAGPEHSSARLERFLQLCADDNMQVVHGLDAGPALSHAAAADEAQLPQAADRDDAQEHVAGQAVAAGRPDPRPVPRSAGRRHADAGARATGVDVQRQGLPRTRQAAHQDGNGRRGHRARRAVLPVPGGGARIRRWRVTHRPRSTFGSRRSRRTWAAGGSWNHGCGRWGTRPSTSAATPAPARRPARTRSTSANRRNWSRRRCAARPRTWSGRRVRVTCA